MTTRQPSTPTGRDLADGEHDGLTAMIVQIEDESRRATVERIRAVVPNSGYEWSQAQRRAIIRILDEEAAR